MCARVCVCVSVSVQVIEKPPVKAKRYCSKTTSRNDGYSHLLHCGKRTSQGLQDTYMCILWTSYIGNAENRVLKSFAEYKLC